MTWLGTKSEGAWFESMRVAFLLCFRNPPHTLHRITNDHEHPRPFFWLKLLRCLHNPLVNPMAIGLSQAYDQDSMMEFIAALSEDFVRGNQ
jgi:hypothetical protein